MTREEALADLEQPPYDPKQQERDKVYVCKKFGISVDEFDAMMKETPRSHYEWASDERVLAMSLKAMRLLRKVRARVGWA